MALLSWNGFPEPPPHALGRSKPDAARSSGALTHPQQPKSLVLRGAEGSLIEATAFVNVRRLFSVRKEYGPVRLRSIERHALPGTRPTDAGRWP